MPLRRATRRAQNPEGSVHSASRCPIRVSALASRVASSPLPRMRSTRRQSSGCDGRSVDKGRSGAGNLKTLRLGDSCSHSRAGPGATICTRVRDESSRARSWTNPPAASRPSARNGNEVVIRAIPGGSDIDAHAKGGNRDPVDCIERRVTMVPPAILDRVGMGSAAPGGCANKVPGPALALHSPISRRCPMGFRGHSGMARSESNASKARENGRGDPPSRA